MALQDSHTFGDLQRVADVLAQGLVHVGDKRRDLAAVGGADGDHQPCQLQGAVQILHKSAVAHRDIQQNGVRPGSQLFGHDGGGNQRNAADGGGDITQGVDFFVGHSNLPTLADDRNADVIDLPEKILLAQAGAGAGNRLHLVNGAAGMAQPAPAHLGDFYAASGHDGGDDQSGLVAHTAGGMLVRLDARNGGKIHHIAGMCHDSGQLGGFGVGHAA